MRKKKGKGKGGMQFKATAKNEKLRMKSVKVYVASETCVTIQQPEFLNHCFKDRIIAHGFNFVRNTHTEAQLR